MDKSRTENSVTNTNTSIPYNLRGNFDEADYFSSSATEDIPQKAPPVIDFANLPPPSEYKKVNSLVNNKEDLQELTPVNNIFSPPQEEPPGVYSAVKEAVNSSEISTEIEPFEVVDETYLVASTSEYDLDVDLEGKIISDIKIYGLKSLSPNIISKQIKTQKGSLFSSDILQQDLQRIYSIGYFSDEMSIDPILKPDDTVELIFSLKENILIKDVVGGTVWDIVIKLDK